MSAPFSTPSLEYLERWAGVLGVGESLGRLSASQLAVIAGHLEAVDLE